MSSKNRRSSELLEEARAFRANPRTTGFHIHLFLSSLDTPRALTVWLLYNSKEHDQLTQLECHPTDYTCPFRFRLDYTATAFLSKADFLETSFDRDAVALEKFEKFELLCQETNNRFRNLSLDPLFKGANVHLLNAVVRKIDQVLGDFDGNEFVDGANWGPGSTTLLKGAEVSAFNKFSSERGITRDLYSLTHQWFADAYPGWNADLSRCYGENWHSFQVGNGIITVPKNSKTNRVIAVEPGLNLWFQKSVGSMIGRRLLRAGIDLRTQENNQKLAKIGSQRNSEVAYATIDFSSASDSISTEVVRALIPHRWFQLMDLCRCQIGVSTAQNRRWHKFSSMGNGFTFELESLIFWAAASAVQESLGIDSKISVFGDDVIIHPDAVELFTSFSKFLGFRVNDSKSFSAGHFRESCGSYYFDGVDCKPIFLKEKLRYAEAFYKLANRIRMLAHRYNFNRSCDSRFLDIWSHLLLGLPEPLRFKVPEPAGDTGFIVNFDEACPARARNGIEGYYYRALASVGVKRQTDKPALIQARLRALQSPLDEPFEVRPEDRSWRNSYHHLYLGLSSFSGRKLPDLAYMNSYTLRRVTKRVVTNSLIPQWYNLGPWE